MANNRRGPRLEQSWFAYLFSMLTVCINFFEFGKEKLFYSSNSWQGNFSKEEIHLVGKIFCCCWACLSPLLYVTEVFQPLPSYCCKTHLSRSDLVCVQPSVALCNILLLLLEVSWVVPGVSWQFCMVSSASSEPFRHRCTLSYPLASSATIQLAPFRIFTL